MVDSSEVDDDLVREGTEIPTRRCARLSGRRAAANRAARAIAVATGKDGLKVHQGIPSDPVPDGEPCWRGPVRLELGAWISAGSVPRRREVGVRGRSAPARERKRSGASRSWPGGRSARGARNPFAPWSGRYMTSSPPRRVRGRGAVSASPGSRSGADALREGHGRAPEARCPIRTHEATDALARSRMSAHPLRHRVLHLPALVWVVCRCGPRGNVCVDPAVPTPARTRVLPSGGRAPNGACASVPGSPTFWGPHEVSFVGYFATGQPVAVGRGLTSAH
jgi:hypothetical protein